MVVQDLYRMRGTVEDFDSSRFDREHYVRFTKFLPRLQRILVGPPEQAATAELLEASPLLQTAEANGGAVKCPDCRGRVGRSPVRGCLLGPTLEQTVPSATVVMVWTGLALNVVGILLGSWRDLSIQSARAVRQVTRWASAAWAGLSRMWPRSHRRGRAQQLQPTSIRSGQAMGSAALMLWPGVTKEMAQDVQISNLAARTDALHDLIKAQAAAQHAQMEQTSVILDKVQAELREDVNGLHERLDDLDVRRAGPRAFGSMLVVCGSVLMTVGGLLAASSAS